MVSLYVIWDLASFFLLFLFLAASFGNLPKRSFWTLRSWVWLIGRANSYCVLSIRQFVLVGLNSVDGSRLGFLTYLAVCAYTFRKPFWDNVSFVFYCAYHKNNRILFCKGLFFIISVTFSYCLNKRYFKQRIHRIGLSSLTNKTTNTIRIKTCYIFYQRQKNAAAPRPLRTKHKRFY